MREMKQGAFYMKKTIIAFVLVASLMMSGCFLRALTSPEDYFADTYCGENSRGDVKTEEIDGTEREVHYYIDEEYGFKYYVYTATYTRKKQDFEYYETVSTTISDFDSKYIDCFMDDFDYSDIAEEYDLEITVESQKVLKDYSTYHVHNIDHDALDDMIIVRTDRDLTKSEEDDILEFIKEAVKDFDTRGHFKFEEDNMGRRVSYYLRIVIISPPEQEDTDDGRTAHFRFGAVGKFE